MDYTHLGRTGLSVSRLCLGTMNFGPETSEDDSHAIMDRAHEHGINFFDTANVYGWQKGEGITEQIIGRWFAQGGGRREKTVIATKLYGSMSDWPNDTFLSALNIRRACDASLQAAPDRLHRPLPDAPRRPFDAVGGDLGGDGDAASAGQDPLRRLLQLRRLAPRPGEGGRQGPALPGAGQRAVDLQPDDPLGRARGAAGRPALRPRRHPVVAAARRPAVRRDPQGARGGRGPIGVRPLRRGAGEAPPHHRGLGRLCADLGEDPAHVGLAWLLSRPAVTAPIIGPRTQDQLDGTLRALEIELDEATLDKLDELFPAPHPTAPSPRRRPTPGEPG